VESIGRYLLAVVCTAMICGIVLRLLGNKSFTAGAVKLLAGFCMVLALVAPIRGLSVPSLDDFSSNVDWDADEILSVSKEETKRAMKELIIQRVQAYILEKADGCDGELTVEVVLSDDDLPIPVAVKLSGNVSPYWRRTLTQTIEKDLGIPAEEQQWILKG